jgi:hypothetical protein
MVETLHDINYGTVQTSKAEQARIDGRCHHNKLCKISAQQQRDCAAFDVNTRASLDKDALNV